MLPYRWVVVAENSGVKIFRTLLRQRNLELIEEFPHPEGRWQEQAFHTDSYGISYASRGRGRHVVGRKVSLVQYERQRFFRLIAHYIDKQFYEHAFQSLIIVAAPQIMGILKDSLSPIVKRSVVQSLTKEFPSWLGSFTLAKHLKMDLDRLRH